MGSQIPPGARTPPGHTGGCGGRGGSTRSFPPEPEADEGPARGAAWGFWGGSQRFGPPFGVKVRRTCPGMSRHSGLKPSRVLGLAAPPCQPQSGAHGKARGPGASAWWGCGSSGPPWGQHSSPGCSPCIQHWAGWGGEPGLFTELPTPTGWTGGGDTYPRGAAGNQHSPSCDLGITVETALTSRAF